MSFVVFFYRLSLTSSVVNNLLSCLNSDFLQIQSHENIIHLDVLLSMRGDFAMLLHYRYMRLKISGVTNYIGSRGKRNGYDCTVIFN